MMRTVPDIRAHNLHGRFKHGVSQCGHALNAVILCVTRDWMKPIRLWQ